MVRAIGLMSRNFFPEKCLSGCTMAKYLSMVTDIVTTIKKRKLNAIADKILQIPFVLTKNRPNSSNVAYAEKNG